MSTGFHPYQDINRSLAYLRSNNVSVFTYQSDMIPTTLGCQS